LRGALSRFLVVTIGNSVKTLRIVSDAIESPKSQDERAGVSHQWLALKMLQGLFF
jgi:hypothetical protein